MRPGRVLGAAGGHALRLATRRQSKRHEMTSTIGLTSPISICNTAAQMAQPIDLPNRVPWSSEADLIPDFRCSSSNSPHASRRGHAPQSPREHLQRLRHMSDSLAYWRIDQRGACCHSIHTRYFANLTFSPDPVLFLGVSDQVCKASRRFAEPARTDGMTSLA